MGQLISQAPPHRATIARIALLAALAAGAIVVLAILLWQALVAGGNPDPLAPGTRGPAAALDIAILVFREGLECILVLAAITASRNEQGIAYRRPIAIGVLAALAATLLTWRIAVTV